MTSKVRIEAVAQCGCCFSKNKRCWLHNKPVVTLGKTHNKKLYSANENFNIYRSSFRTFSKLGLFSNLVVVEQATPSVLEFVDSFADLYIVLGLHKTKKTPLFKGSIERYSVSTYVGTGKNLRVRSNYVVPDCESIDTFVEHVGSLGFSWFNCSVGQFYKYAQDFVHTPHLSTFRYMTKPSFRQTISGHVEEKPKGLFA